MFGLKEISNLHSMKTKQNKKIPGIVLERWFVEV